MEAPDASLVIGGEEFLLMPERSAYWVRRRTLLVADLHLGKAEVFGTNGVGVPRGVQEEQLGRLSRAIARSGAERVLILGDLLHARAGLTPAMIAEVKGWRRGVSAEMAVVPGNHDRGLGRVAREWSMGVLGGTHEEDGFVFAHEPAPRRGRFVWGGHEHPAIHLRCGGDSVKLACFRVGRRVGVLPAFGLFAAGGGPRPARGDRVFAIAEDRVIEIG